MQTSGITDIAHGIQLAVAPVFLLSGVGVTLTVLTNRLARIIDRARSLESSLATTAEPAAARMRDELRVLSRRARLGAPGVIHFHPRALPPRFSHVPPFSRLPLPPGPP